MSITETILKELLEVKGTVSELPTRAETREIALEIATTAGTIAAAAAVKKHVEDCELKRINDEMEKRREIRISKKSALWWVKMTAAVLGLVTASAGIKAIIDALLQLA